MVTSDGSVRGAPPLPAVPSLREVVQEFIVARARAEVRAALPEDRDAARVPSFDAIVDRVVEAMCIAHEYRVESLEAERLQDAVHIERMHELLEMLMSSSPR